MIESNASLSEEPTDMLEQVDLVDILKARIPEENTKAENVQLVEISDSGLHQEILNRGQFSRVDLEEILKNEEKLQAAVEYLVKENERLTKIGKSKEEKIFASIEMIVSQRDWVHSLLEDNVALRGEIEQHVKEKLDFDADTAYQISSLKNSKEELEEETNNLKAEINQLENKVADLDEQLKKSAGVLKKSQVHKNALSEKIELMENNQLKYKYYLGALSIAAFVFFSLAVVSFLNSETNKKANASGLASNNDSEDSNYVANNHNSNPGVSIAQDSPIEIAPEGFISSDVSDPILVDNTKVLDDKKVDEILKDPSLGFDDNITKPIKTPIAKKSNSKSFDTTSTSNVVKTETPAVKSNSKSISIDKKTVKTETVSNKKPKKPSQTYIIKEKDSLYQISKKFYGSGNYVNKIKKENKLGNSLVPGKKLIISALDEE